MSFFEKSGLPRDQLAKVWAFADTTRRGYLDFEAFKRALGLVSIAQKTGVVSLEEFQSQQQAGMIPPPQLVGMALQQGWTDTDNFSPSYGSSDGARTPKVMVAPVPSPGNRPAGPATYHAGRNNAGPAMPLSPQNNGGASKLGPFSQFQQRDAPPFVASTIPDKKKRTKKRGPMTTKDVTSVTDGLRKIYFEKVRIVSPNECILYSTLTRCFSFVDTSCGADVQIW